MSFQNKYYSNYDADMSTLASLPSRFAPLVENELEKNENCIWADQPIPYWFSVAAIAPCLFAIPWTAFAVFWMCAAAGFKIPDFSGPQGLFCLFGVPFVLVGLGMLSIPFWVRRRQRRTIYVITNQRAIIIEGGLFAFSIHSYAPDELTELHRTQNSKGIGSISFARKQNNFNGARQMAAFAGGYDGFQNIHNVKQVEALLRSLAKDAKNTDDN